MKSMSLLKKNLTKTFEDMPYLFLRMEQSRKCISQLAKREMVLTSWFRYSALSWPVINVLYPSATPPREEERTLKSAAKVSASTSLRKSLGMWSSPTTFI